MNTLKNWQEDAIKEAYTSVFSDLNKVTGVKDLTQRKINNILEDQAAIILKKNGYGDMLTYWSKISKSYKLCKDITNATKAKDLSKALNDVGDIKDALLPGEGKACVTVRKLCLL